MPIPPCPQDVLEAARAAVPYQNKGDVRWLPKDVRDRMADAVARAVWDVLYPQISTAVLAAVQELGEQLVAIHLESGERP